MTLPGTHLSPLTAAYRFIAFSIGSFFAPFNYFAATFFFLQSRCAEMIVSQHNTHRTHRQILAHDKTCTGLLLCCYYVCWSTTVLAICGYLQSDGWENTTSFIPTAASIQKFSTCSVLFSLSGSWSRSDHCHPLLCIIKSKWEDTCLIDMR